MSLGVELSAYRHIDHENIETCNEHPELADGFAIYLTNPHAFHLEDFTILDIHSENPSWDPAECRSRAREAAWRKADGLARHIGCDLWIKMVPHQFIE